MARKLFHRNSKCEADVLFIPITGITPKHCANAKIDPMASWKLPSNEKSFRVACFKYWISSTEINWHLQKIKQKSQNCNALKCTHYTVPVLTNEPFPIRRFWMVEIRRIPSLKYSRKIEWKVLWVFGQCRLLPAHFSLRKILFDYIVRLDSCTRTDASRWSRILNKLQLFHVKALFKLCTWTKV